MIYFLTAGICWLACMLIAWEIDESRRRWGMLAGGTALGLWSVAYGFIVTCPTVECALTASRGAFAPVGLGAWAAVVFFGSVVGEREASARKLLVFALLATVIHLPGVVGPLAIRSMERTAAGPVWNYGPWAAVIWGSWLIGAPVLTGRLIRRRCRLPWDERNRLVWVVCCFLVFLVCLTAVMGVFGYLLGMHNVMLAVPAMMWLPCLAAVLVFRVHSLPDLWGFLGKIVPNERSRFLREFTQLAGALDGYRSAADLERDLSRLLHAPVRFVRTEPGLWIAPGGLGRLYSPADGRRIALIEGRVRELETGTTESISSRKLSASAGSSDCLWPAASEPALAERTLVEAALHKKRLLVLSLPPGMWGGVHITPRHVQSPEVTEIRCDSWEPVSPEQWRPHLARAGESGTIVVSVRQLTVIPVGVMVKLGSLIAAGTQAVLISFNGRRPEGPALELCGELGENAQVVRLSEQLDREADVRAWMKRLADALPGHPDPDEMLSAEAMRSLIEMDWALDGEAFSELLECSLLENG